MIRNVVVAGVGGHGVLTASRILAGTALATGFDVRTSEVHGMSQRGGSVISHVRYGERVHSPLIPRGEAHALLALERLEALRHLSLLRRDGTLVAGDAEIPPAPTGADPPPYPREIESLCRERVPAAIFLPAGEAARELGEPRVANVVLLGAYAALAPELEAEAWRRVVEGAFDARYRSVNAAALRRGRELVRPPVGAPAPP